MTVPDLAPDATLTTERPTAPTWPKVVRWAVVLGILIPFLWSTAGLEISIARVWKAPEQVWTLISGMYPPDFSDMTRLTSKVLESIYIAWIGTLIGALFSFPAGFAAAANISPRWIMVPTRAFLSAIRAFPELILAIIFIVPFGLGPFTGAIAIGLHSIGTLGKLTSEVIEGVDDGPVEAIAASGGSRLLRMRYGVVPQAMPNIVAYWLYRFEINVRASAVLGLVGAGGIGAEIVARLRFRGDWPKAGAALILTIVAVLLIDAASASIRRRIITGQPSRSPISKWMMAITGSHRDPRFEVEAS
ncbi:MAG: phosphonate ABC transporter, permease protein PhnE [Acidimicrobiia bacterium]|nr:MAG: phosphonate ABC transporter, permease protein PhnE [Acidimicrobiia bacterium]